MELSIIIVNWKSVDFLKKCLKSIYNNISDIKFEVIVIDNASFDGCAEMIEKKFKKVIFIQSKNNLGFAGANNLGYQKSGGKVILFLNPDTEVLGNAIQTMYSFLTHTQDAGIVGCKLLNSDHTLQTNCIMPFPNLMNEIFDIEFLKLKLYKMKIWGIYPLFSDNNQSYVVDVINGACIMIKREAFVKVDGFCSDYFMFSDDVDLGYKVKEAGYKSYFLPMVSIVHHGGKSTLNKKNAFFTALLIRESRKLFFRKTKGNFYANLYQAEMMVTSIFRIIFIILFFPINILTKKFSYFYISLLKWKNILSWSIGLEKWTKNIK